jgi:hypothetical protein
VHVYEEALAAMNSAERRTGKQSACYHIYDLGELQLDPYLLSVVSGPIKLLWMHLARSYPELVHKLVMVNVPTFINLLNAAISPFLPQRTAVGSTLSRILSEHISFSQKS